MTKEMFWQQAESLQPQLQEIRRQLHRHPETGFDLPKTLALVRRELEHMGLTPTPCGKAGLEVLVGGKQPGKTILLRADMDALPLQEEADVDYASQIPGVMHGCGHDMHTAMLLGAAKLLKQHEDTLPGSVKLMFQPAEEIFQGACDMIDAGILTQPPVDAALMLHVIAGVPIPSGTVLAPQGGIGTASCEQYRIHIRGKGGHGSAPHQAIDPLTAAAHIHLALQQIRSMELDPSGYGVFTTCRIQAGTTANVIPDTADMWGTIRTLDPSGKIGEQIKTRMADIAKGVGGALRCEVEVTFFDFCPCMVIDEPLAEEIRAYGTQLLGDKLQSMPMQGGGSEDFSFISHLVPTVPLFFAAGDARDGYTFSQHHPKVKFDDSVLYQGSALYAWTALRYLEAHAAQRK